MLPQRVIRHPGSALGEAIGKLIEESLREQIRDVASPEGYAVQSMTLRNHLQNRHQIDTVVSDAQDNPIILVEPKYLRYKKHNWDKGSRLCIGHYSLRRTYSSIRKSIGILAGQWTDPSLKFLKSFGVETHRIEFDHIADVLAGYNVPFRWEESDRHTSARAWARFCDLNSGERMKIGELLTQPVCEAVKESVKLTLTADPDVAKRVETVELSIKTTAGEHIVYSFDKIADAIQRLLDFVRDVEDLKKFLH